MQQQETKNNTLHVILDTNILNSSDLDAFFGNKDNLQRYPGLVTWCIPQMVIDELKKQKDEAFQKSMDDLEKNKVYQRFFKKDIEEIDLPPIISSIAK